MEETLILKNFTDQVVDVRLEWIPYSKSNAKVIKQDFLTKHSIDFAVMPETKITLQPQETKPVTISFTVPKDIISGDYYGSVLATDGQTQTKADFTLRILGKLTETIEGNSYFDNKRLKIELSNMSNKTTQIEVSASLNSLLGHVKQMSFDKRELLSGEVVTVQTQELDLLPGYYQAKIDLKYSDKALEKMLIVSFWVHPEVFIVSFGTLVLSIVLFIYFRIAMKRNVV